MESRRALVVASLTAALSWVALLVPATHTLAAVAGGIGLCAAAALYVLSLLMVGWHATAATPELHSHARAHEGTAAAARTAEDRATPGVDPAAARTALAG